MSLLMLILALFLYGFTAGYVIFRLRRRHGKEDRESLMLGRIGWFLAGLSFALGIALLAYALWSGWQDG